MILKFIFYDTEILFLRYNILITTLLDYNKYYNGVLKSKLYKNLNMMNYMVLIIQTIKMIITYKKKEEFFNFFENFDKKDYILEDIDSYFYHIDNDLYKTCVELFNYFRDIILNIKKFLLEIKIVKDEIKEKILDYNKKDVLSLSKSSSNDLKKIIFETMGIKEISSSINREEIIDEIITILLNIREKSNNKQILKDIISNTNLKKIYLLEKFIKVDNITKEIKIYLEGSNIEKLRNLLILENNNNLKKIKRILIKVLKIDYDKLIELNKYYNFINSWDDIYVYNFDKIYYIINDTNTIKKEIKKSKL